MASQRSRAPRNGARGDQQDGINQKEMWDEVKRLIHGLATGERDAASHHAKIMAMEERLHTKKGISEGNYDIYMTTSNCILNRLKLL